MREKLLEEAAEGIYLNTTHLGRADGEVGRESSGSNDEQSNPQQDTRQSLNKELASTNYY
jgi:hypothetical protein